jgi:hypothetical protein
LAKNDLREQGELKVCAVKIPARERRRSPNVKQNFRRTANARQIYVAQGQAPGAKGYKPGKTEAGKGRRENEFEDQKIPGASPEALVKHSIHFVGVSLLTTRLPNVASKLAPTAPNQAGASSEVLDPLALGG